MPPSSAPLLEYDGPVPSHLPPAWSAGGMPPGAPQASTALGLASSNYPRVDGTCVGKWPSGGQGVYSGACIGHDEPAINPFSDLPGSGGNVSWNVTLPVDGSATHNQSDNYIAIWFGMNLADPYGYNGQCFLELQMYPDTNASGAPQVGAWSAFAVAWQIQLSTGFENPCFARGLTDRATGLPFQMGGGDALYVNMTGWIGSPYGENISVFDQSTGHRSVLTLYNHKLHYALDPAYLENNLDDALPWSPGGDLPVSFAFESGHTSNGPGNDTFGGCNAGAPPPSILNPSTPCGSYDPKAWALDTKSPWQFRPVVFFNAHARETAVQYGFEQDFGAAAWIDGLSYGTCTGRDGSAYCSYPWYSYSAPEGAFNFGATDYAGTTQDFGQYHEYDASLQTDSSGLNYYPVRNFTWEANPGLDLTIVVHGSGSVRFLNYTVAGTTTLRHLGAGAYSLNAVPATGSFFRGYAGSSGLSVDDLASPWSSLRLLGNATLTATFPPVAPATTPVTLLDAGNHGRVMTVPGFTFHLNGLLPPVAAGFGLLPLFDSTAKEAANGTTLPWAPGIYSIQAEPDPGFNFTGWSATSGLYLYTPGANYTWVNVSARAGTITAHYAPTALSARVWVDTDPAQGGTVRFGGASYGSGSVFGARPGSYAITAVAAPGYTFVGWSPGFLSTLTDFAATTRVLVQNGNDYLTAAFSSTPTVTDGAAAGTGLLALNGHPVGGSLTLSQVGDAVYELSAEPSANRTFVDWTVNSTTNAWVTNTSGAVTTVQVNASVTIVPHFAPGSPAWKVAWTSRGGSIVLNGLGPLHGTGSVGLANGTYVLTERPARGLAFGSWHTTGLLHVATSYLLNSSTPADVENSAGTWTFLYTLRVTGPGTLTAGFPAQTEPVTFVPAPYRTGDAAVLSGPGGNFTIAAGHTAMVPPGPYTLDLAGPGIARLHWFASAGNLTVGHARATPTTLDVVGSGALYAVAEPVGFGPVSLSPVATAPSPSPGAVLPAPSGPGPLASGYVGPVAGVWGPSRMV